MKDQVLITGATGHVGFHVLTRALDAGYRVRAAVRNTEKSETLARALASKIGQDDSRLTYAIVPDLTAPGAYDEAVKDVQYIIHVASPTPSPNISPDQYEEALIDPAVKGTLGILESARNAPGVRRIVITSSIAAIIPFQALANGSDEVFTAESRIASPDTATLHHLFQAYAASKSRALNVAEAWVKNEHPSFDVVHVLPSYVMGRDESLTSRKSLRSQGTNKHIMYVALGETTSQAVVSATVHVDDVARVHVGALNPEIPGNTSYVVTSHSSPSTFNGNNYDDIRQMVAKNFPEAVAAGTLPGNGRQPFNVLRFDASVTEEKFGFTHLSFEEQVKDVIWQYLGAKEA
jgi:nucleoside-diphosphate-sugar epimerase